MVLARVAFLLLLLAALSHPAVAAASLQPAQSRELLPDIAFLDMDDKPARLSDFRGRVVVLNLWATWCAPCREEMPFFDRLQQIFADQPVTVLALSVDRGEAGRIREFLAEIGVHRLAVYRDPKMRAIQELRVPGLPATILVDRAGREALRQLGVAVWDAPEVVALIRDLLAEAVP